MRRWEHSFADNITWSFKIHQYADPFILFHWHFILHGYSVNTHYSFSTHASLTIRAIKYIYSTWIFPIKNDSKEKTDTIYNIIQLLKEEKVFMQKKYRVENKFYSRSYAVCAWNEMKWNGMKKNSQMTTLVTYKSLFM